MIYFGIDPGFSGGIARIGGGTESFVWPMPTVKNGKRTELDVDWLKTNFPITAISGNVVAIEKAQPMPKQGVVSTGNYMMWFGVLRGFFQSRDCRLMLIPPRTWQKIYGINSSIGDTKSQSIACCKRLYPDISLRPTDRCKKDSDGMADALLIAEYTRRTTMMDSKLEPFE